MHNGEYQPKKETMKMKTIYDISYLIQISTYQIFMDTCNEKISK